MTCKLGCPAQTGRAHFAIRGDPLRFFKINNRRASILLFPSPVYFLSQETIRKFQTFCQVACRYVPVLLSSKVIRRGVMTNAEAQPGCFLQSSTSASERDDGIMIKSRCSRKVQFSSAPDLVFEYVVEHETSSELSEVCGAEAAIGQSGSPATSVGVVIIRTCLARRLKAEACQVSPGSKKKATHRRQLKRKIFS